MTTTVLSLPQGADALARPFRLLSLKPAAPASPGAPHAAHTATKGRTHKKGKAATTASNGDTN